MKRNKYINSFDTTAEYDNYIESAFPEFPNVSLTKDNGELHYMRTSPNDHVIYGELVDATQNIPNIQLYKNYLKVKAYTPTVDTLTNTFYIDDWGTVPSFNTLAGNFLTNRSNIKTIKKFKGLNTSNVTSMGSMFNGCSSLTSVDLSSLNTSNVTTMDNMFNACKALTSLDVSNFNTSNVTTMDSMFNGCEALTSLDVSNFNTSNVTTMNSMFNVCKALTSLDLSGWDVSNVTNMYQMFNYCTSLTSLDLSGWDVSNVTNIEYIFSACYALTDVYITVEATLMKLTNNLSSQGNNYIPSNNGNCTIHYNGTDYKWQNNAWTPQSV